MCGRRPSRVEDEVAGDLDLDGVVEVNGDGEAGGGVTSAGEAVSRGARRQVSTSAGEHVGR